MPMYIGVPYHTTDSGVWIRKDVYTMALEYAFHQYMCLEVGYRYEVGKHMGGEWYIHGGAYHRDTVMSDSVFMRTLLDMGVCTDTIMYCMNKAMQYEASIPV